MSAGIEGEFLRQKVRKSAYFPVTLHAKKQRAGNAGHCGRRYIPEHRIIGIRYTHVSGMYHQAYTSQRAYMFTRLACNSF